MTTFGPYAPRLVFDWLRTEPERQWSRREGSMVFVDVSGFTAMSERLARRGRVGAEEVTDVIGSTFTELLAVAYSVDGSLLKFGGDALLLWFTGDGHPERAAWAAHSMRGALRAMGDIHTSAGKVRLRMSVGAHCGEFDFFLVGESHRELVVTGPAVSEVVRMEGSATAGRIVASEALAELLPRQAVGGEYGAGRLVRKLSHEPPRLPIPLQVDALPDADVVVSTALRRHLGAGGGQPEHRRVAVGFLHFDGTDHAIARRGGEAVARDLHELVAGVQSACDQHEVCFLGSDLDADGGKLILTAGAPDAREDDADRLLRAVHEVVATGSAVPVRAGVHHGPIFSGEVGPAYRRTYTVMGDAVNTAARVMAHAGPGQVLATADVLDRSGTLFRVTELAGFAAKGKSEPIVAFEVGELIGARHVPAASHLPLVGRDDELHQLAALISRPGPGVVQVIGDGGVGKSRLAADAFELLDVEPAATAWCERYQHATPYFASAQLLRTTLDLPEGSPQARLEALESAVARIAPDQLEWLPLIGDACGVTAGSTPAVDAIDEKHRRAALHRAVAGVLERIGHEGRVHWLIEDGEWLDEPSSALLAHLGRGPADLGVVITTREPVVDLPDRIELSSLNVADAAALARLAAGHLLPDQALRVAEMAGGNPLFVQELVARAAERDRTDLPESLEVAVTARIDDLEPTARRALRRLAVLGRTIPPRLLGAAGEHIELAGLHEFVEVLHDGAARFRQALYREVAYQGLPYNERVQLHQAAVEQLCAADEPEEHAEEISAHAHHAGDVRRSWTFGRLAGERAAGRQAHADAVTHRRWAADAGERVGAPIADRSDAWFDVGWSLRSLGDLADASDAFQRARRHAAGDAMRASWLCYQQGEIRESRQQASAAIRWFNKALTHLDGAPSSAEVLEARARITAAIGSVRFHKGELREAERIMREGLALAEAAESHSVQGGIHNALLMVMARSDLAEAERHARRAIDLLTRSGREEAAAYTVNNMGRLAAATGRWHEAEQHYAEAAERLERAGDVIAAATVRSNSCWLASRRGLPHQAIAGLERSMSDLAAAGSFYVHHAATNLGRTLAVAGRPGDAIALLGPTIAHLREAGDIEVAVEAEVWFAEALALSGQGSTALDALPQLDDNDGMAPSAERVRAATLASLNRHQDAREAADRALHLARAKGNRWEEGLTLEVLANLDCARDGEAAEQARQILGSLEVVATFPPAPLQSVLPQLVAVDA